MNGLDVTLSNEIDPLRTKSLIAGALALVLCFIGLFFNRGEFFRAYLIAYVFWIGVPLGCLGILMIHHLVGGTWGFVIQRCLEAAVRTFPIMFLLFVPLRSEEHTSELQSHVNIVCRLLLEKKKNGNTER